MEVAWDLATVLQRLETRTFQLVVCEIMLPPGFDREGLDVCRVLKAHPRRPKIAILTDRADSGALEAAQDCSDLVMQKDWFERDILKALLRLVDDDVRRRGIIVDLNTVESFLPNVSLYRAREAALTAWIVNRDPRFRQAIQDMDAIDVAIKSARQNLRIG